MEPITYANGSTLEDPAISYGIVFSNFMSKGVFTFQGGTDKLIGLMEAELRKNGVDICIKADVGRSTVRAAACAPSGQWAAIDAGRCRTRTQETIWSVARYFDRVRRRRARRAAEQFQHAGYMGSRRRTGRRATGDLLFNSRPCFARICCCRDVPAARTRFTIRAARQPRA
jgi:hypothetical protein